ncbi:MAG: hypothetical protein WAT23_16125, partial [Chromatiaceae bacterium]
GLWRASANPGRVEVLPCHRYGLIRLTKSMMLPRDSGSGLCGSGQPPTADFTGWFVSNHVALRRYVLRWSLASILHRPFSD